MRKLMIAAMALCASSVWAQTASISEAVQPLTPSLTVSVLRETSLLLYPNLCSHGPIPDLSSGPQPLECMANIGNALWRSGYPVGVDASGRSYYMAPTDPAKIQFDPTHFGLVLQRSKGSAPVEDVIRLLTLKCATPVCDNDRTNFSYGEQFSFDVTNGRILLAVRATTMIPQPGFALVTDDEIGLIVIAGLPTLLDTLLTFLPGGQSLSAVTPAHPDGFRSADSLQAWTGNVRSLPDWSQAQPLTCSAATAPTPGQIVSIADTLPDPDTGVGRYYVMASQNGPDRRLGRQYVNAAFSARDAAALPPCE